MTSLRIWSVLFSFGQEDELVDFYHLLLYTVTVAKRKSFTDMPPAIH